ncbi:hypothetical protein HFP15_34930 [Amycolatopsis sp. K13G38]|uniref:Alpha/beta hydrolase n=1 Tax=Amycolatopsis acididurans TaxID=2724524 RepID=A0ABX1JEA5_9PSEU|nr:hypothetical protein [Amycolatopsis acididurans]NKQ58068.1 hypothetical protein [Amycolatopsis acididurans]
MVDRNDAGPRWSRPGPHRVVTAEFDDWAVVNGQRVAVIVRYPHSDTPLPAVVLCHGLGGDHRGYAGLGVWLASHGYAVLHPQFCDSLAIAGPRLGLPVTQQRARPEDASVRELLHTMLFDREHWVSRVARVHAVIDSLAGQSRVPARIRADGVLVAGHSFGAYTAQLLLGTRLFDVGLDHERFAHPAVVGGILLSPQGSGDRGLTARSWEGVTTPVLTVTATHDFGARGEGLPWRREVFDRAPARFKHLAVVRGGDHQLGGIPRADNEDQAGARVRTAIAAVTTAFADHVHGDEVAGAWLASGPFPTILDHTHRETACPTS